MNTRVANSSAASVFYRIFRKTLALLDKSFSLLFSLSICTYEPLFLLIARGSSYDGEGLNYYGQRCFLGRDL